MVGSQFTEWLMKSVHLKDGERFMEFMEVCSNYETYKNLINTNPVYDPLQIKGQLPPYINIFYQ